MTGALAAWLPADSPRPRGVRGMRSRLVGRVACSEQARKGQLRHPRFPGLREDKRPARVVQEIPARRQRGGRPDR